MLYAKVYGKMCQGLKGNAIKLGVRGFVRICIETCARGYFGAWKYRFRKKGIVGIFLLQHGRISTSTK